jgi:hypothetical protein
MMESVINKVFACQWRKSSELTPKNSDLGGLNQSFFNKIKKVSPKVFFLDGRVLQGIPCTPKINFGQERLASGRQV